VNDPATEKRMGELIDRHWRATYQAAFRVLCDRDEALDAAQEALLALHENLDGIVDKQAGSWLWRVATNKALDRYRRRRLRAATSGYDGLVDPGPQPPALADLAEERTRLFHALTGLSPRQREIVMRRTLEEETFVAIAADLGISQGATKVHYRRGLAALRNSLDRAEVREERTNDR
jgi:RNA polymerase sigma-70 factor (ECF subfamily)